MFDFISSADFQEQLLALMFSVMVVWYAWRIFRYLRGYVLILCLSMWLIIAKGILVYIPRLIGLDWLADFISSNLVRFISYALVYVLLGYVTYRRWKANHGDAEARAQIDNEKDDF
jgi:hypothetical protein